MGIHRDDSGCEQITDPKMSVSSTSIRECSSCGHIKPVVAFATFRSRSGELRRRGICKQCRDARSIGNIEHQQEYRKQYNERTAPERRRKQNVRRLEAKKFVDEYKEANPCVDCKRKFPAVAMDFDHVRGGKIRNVAGFVSGAYKLDLIKEEIAKCDLVCACCHRIRTASRSENLGRPGPRKPAPDQLESYPEKRSLSNVKHIEFNGETHSISEWARRLGMPAQVISYRLRRGYPVEAAFEKASYTIGSSPVRVRRNSETYSKKLTAELVALIRADRAQGTTQQRIADKYSISQSTVSAIVLGRTWQ